MSGVERFDAVVVGAGFGGLYMLYRLREQGFSVIGFETAPEVGGTWYWNRYPGARCDVESMDYCFSFDEALQQEWNWTERFATQSEILDYLKHVADRFELRPLIRFETRVESAVWQDDSARWQVSTDVGTVIHARHVIMATGSLSAAKPPDIEGIDDFRGELVHTAYWPECGVDCAGRRVGVIGTGSSAIQAIPLLAEEAAHLTVFQRTPSYTLPARNAPLDPDWVAGRKANYAAYRKLCRETNAGVPFVSTGKPALKVSDAEREAAYEAAWQSGGAGFQNTFTDLMIDRAANDTAAEFIRRKIRQIVRDPETAEALIPRDYPLGSKRVAVDTGYWETFNRDNVRLVDLRSDPIERVVADGVQLADGEVPLDVLVLATGFDAMTGSFLRVDVRNADGVALRDKWASGPRTYLGLMTSGFPNLFFIAGPGSPSVLSNMVLSIEQHVDWIIECLKMLGDSETVRIEPEPEAEAAWIDQVNELAARTLFVEGDSWYLGANVPGKARVFMPFPGGIDRYRQTCDRVVRDGYRGFRIAGRVARNTI